MKSAYLDAFSGLSGDMMIGALIDAGADPAGLERAVAALGLSGYRIAVGRRDLSGIAAVKFDVAVTEPQPERHLGEILAMIERARLAPRAERAAREIFQALAEAEAKVHRTTPDEVHFHEVGAVDSIIDIVGAAWALDQLGVADLIVSPLPAGNGFVRSRHGVIPVPAPATAELLRGLPVHSAAGEGERVTPTGAAIVAALATGVGRPPAMTVTGIGYGAGSKDFPDLPNVLRLFLGERPAELARDEVQVIETHLDDMNPEVLGFVLERLLAAGAFDAAFAPLQMKKNRPAVRLTVIAPPERLEALAALILHETTAIGVRHYPVARLKLFRREEERSTSLGPVRVKVLRDGETVVRVVPEYESCRQIAEARQLPLLEVYRIVEGEVGRQ